MTDKTKLSDYAYVRLKEMILNNVLRPGAHIEESALCDMLNISRTPLREAVNRLMYDGMLTSIPHKGIFISDINVQTVAELFRARKLIEPMILMFVADNIDRQRMSDFRMRTENILANGPYEALHALDYEFHSYINNCCSNRYLLRMSEYIGDQFQRVRTQSFFPKERSENGAREHLAIIDSFLSGDFDALPQLMLDHITSTERFYYMNLLSNDAPQKNISYLKSHMDELK